MPRQPRQRTPQSRYWIFTLNNPLQNEVEYDPELHTYLIAGDEIAPATETPHVQGFVVMKIRKRLSGMKRWLPRAHFEIMRGTSIQARDYCMKDGEWEEYGELPKPAAQINRQRMQAMWDDAYFNAKMQELDRIPKHILVKNYHAFKRIMQDNPIIPDDLPNKQNLWIVAPSGYGKSTYAREKFPDFYDKAPNKWWTGYMGQDAVICDDFGPKQCEHLGWYMKRWADNFAFPMETKGGGRMIRPKHIVVTSQYSIEECFEDPLVRDAINNRFTVKELERWEARQQMIESDEEQAVIALEQLYARDEEIETEEAYNERMEGRHLEVKEADTATTVEYDSDDEAIDLT